MNNIFIPSTAQLPYCIIYFVPSLPTPGKTDTDFEDAFLAFQKGMLLLITNFCIIYLFLHALIFYQPVWTPETTFQTVENTVTFLIGQVFFANWHFSLYTESILLSRCEWVSVSVEPCTYIVLFLRTSKPIRMDFLSIFLEDLKFYSKHLETGLSCAIFRNSS